MGVSGRGFNSQKRTTRLYLGIKALMSSHFGTMKTNTGTFCWMLVGPYWNYEEPIRMYHSSTHRNIAFEALKSTNFQSRLEPCTRSKTENSFASSFVNTSDYVKKARPRMRRSKRSPVRLQIQLKGTPITWRTDRARE